VPQPALNVNMDAQTNVESLSFSLDGLAKENMLVTGLSAAASAAVSAPGHAWQEVSRSRRAWPEPRSTA